MARIRTIKPDFWTDEEIVELDPMDRLLFVGLWNFCDDQGYIDYRPKKLKMQIFPADDFDLPAAMERLRKSSLVDAYDAPTGVVAHIRNWSKHQRVNNPSKERYVAADLQERDTFDGPSTGLLSPNDSWSAEGKGREGKGKEGKKRAGSADDAAPTPPETEPIEQRVTKSAYEMVGKAFNFVAVRQIVKWAIHVRDEEPRRVHDAVIAIYQMGKPITKQTLGQHLDGHLGNGRPSDRQAEILKREAQAAAEYDASLLEIET